MDRMTLVEKAQQLANEEISGQAACDEPRYDELMKLGTEEAIKILAHEFLQDAADYNFGE